MGKKGGLELFLSPSLSPSPLLSLSLGSPLKTFLLSSSRISFLNWQIIAAAQRPGDLARCPLLLATKYRTVCGSSLNRLASNPHPHTVWHRIRAKYTAVILDR